MVGNPMKVRVGFTLVVNPDVLKQWWSWRPLGERGLKFSSRRALKMLAACAEFYGRDEIRKQLEEAERALP